MVRAEVVAGALPEWCCGSSRAELARSRRGSARAARSHAALSTRGSRPARPATMQFLHVIAQWNNKIKAR
jgi:hypothetical protein